MTRLRGRAPRGERAYGKVPRNRGKNTTLLASATLEGQIVLLDNLGAHKTRKARELIEARGAEVWFLPTYSPDLNPIEEAFSKVKTLLKKAAAHTKEALVEAIARALAAVTTEDARGWFSHSGYELRDRSL